MTKRGKGADTKIRWRRKKTLAGTFRMVFLGKKPRKRKR